jgi:DNA-directed RNA polymerase subunit RPC12/RpoP
MATSLETRVRQLEGGTGSRCPECGFDGDWSKVKFHFEDTGRGQSERCGTCGRPTRIVLTWGQKV